MGCGSSAAAVQFSAVRSSKVVPVAPDELSKHGESGGTRGKSPEILFQVTVEDQVQLDDANLCSFKSYNWADAAHASLAPARPEHERNLRRIERFMRSARRNEATFRTLVGREA